MTTVNEALKLYWAGLISRRYLFTLVGYTDAEIDRIEAATYLGV